MSYQDIILEKRERSAWITLNKPHVLNAFGRQTFLDVLDALNEIGKDISIVAVVIKGAGGNFCAGVDLKEHSERIAKGDPALMAEFTAIADRFFLTVENYKKVTIAMINGVCMAGGFELALCCDFIFAEEKARIGDGHIKTGLVPNGGASIRLPRLIGMRKAKELLFTGELISGIEAEKIGLINRAVPQEKLEEEVENFIGKLVDKPPLALEGIKILCNKGASCSLEAGLELEHQVVNFLQRTEDFQESILAFKEKRKPLYRGK
jgi:enoyl-CoA hydratase/carnithine racemase